MTWGRRVGSGRQEPHRADEHGHNHPDRTETHGEHSDPSACLDAREPGLADGPSLPRGSQGQVEKLSASLTCRPRQATERGIVVNRNSCVVAVRRERRLGFSELTIHFGQRFPSERQLRRRHHGGGGAGERCVSRDDRSRLYIEPFPLAAECGLRRGSRGVRRRARGYAEGARDLDERFIGRRRRLDADMDGRTVVDESYVMAIEQ